MKRTTKTRLVALAILGLATSACSMDMRSVADMMDGLPPPPATPPAP